MKNIFKTMLAAAVISLLAALTTGICAFAEVHKGIDNAIAWTFDTETGILTFDKEKSDVAFTESWMKYADQVRYIEMKGLNMGSYLHNSYSDAYPNLIKVYGRWHNPAKSWKQGDPELIWEIDYTGYDPVFTLDAKGSVFKGGTRESFTFWEDVFRDTSWWDWAQTGGTFVLGDGITGFSDDVPVISGMIGYDLDVLKIGKNVPVSSQFAERANEEYIVDQDNPYLATYNGALYTKDYRSLLALPNDHLDTPLHPNVQNFGEGTLGETQGTSSWQYDPATQTMTLKGKGIWSMVSNFNRFLYKIERLIISDGITALESSVPSPQTLVIGRDFQFTEAQYFPQPMQEIELSAQNSHLSMYGGALYSKDYKVLLSNPSSNSAITFHPDVKIFGMCSLANLNTSFLVVPWGVTRIEPLALANIGLDSLKTIPIVLPDTLQYIGNQRSATVAINTEYFFSPENRAEMEVPHHGGAIRQELLPAYLKGATTIKEIYEMLENGAASQKNGWLKEGGKWYYYEKDAKKTGWQFINDVWYYLDANGIMQTGWQKINGVWYYLQDWGGMISDGMYRIDGEWYYFRDWGGMVANSWQWINDVWYYFCDWGGRATSSWQLVGGKWYYFRDWGGMAHDAWIQNWDKKWYYVGSDGAMLTNTRTPDGYYVNAAGVWIS